MNAQSPLNKKENISPLTTIRVNSVDFFRGLTMFLLAGESAGLYGYLLETNNGFIHSLGTQLHHHQWHGLHFWDLIQPFFMFIVGVAIPFAVANRIKKGDSMKSITLHAFRRSFLLLLLGWGLYCIGPGRIVWRFQNVLAQLSVTYLVAFLIRNRSFLFQVGLTIALLIIYDISYRIFPVDGFNNPWVPFENMGSWFNNKIEGVEKASIWASINVVSTTAHTVWGVLCGKLLMSDRTPQKKIQILFTAGIAALAIGYTLDLAGITPIIKKIATSSFVFASGGWTILTLCLFYYLIDVKKLFATGFDIFKVVGMNAIFIYMFFEVGGAQLLSKIFKPFTGALFNWGGEITVGVMNSLVVWAAMWYMCYWLYKNRILIKI